MKVTRDHGNRAVFFAGINQVEVREMPPPTTGRAESNQVEVQVRYSGICGSDLHLLGGQHPFVKPPVIPGHEITGEVSEVGDAVTTVSPGDRVLLDPIMPCGVCPRCEAGEQNLCQAACVIGFKVPGGMQTTFLTSGDRCHLIPEGLGLELACLAEPLATCVHAVGKVPRGGTVLVVGAGSIGLLMLMTLRAAGYQHISSVDPLESKRALALSMGAKSAYGVDRVEGLFDTVIDCVSTGPSMSQAVDHCRPGGTILVVGVPTGRVEIQLAETQRFERAIVASALYVGAELDRALSLLAGGVVDGASLITAVVDFNEAARAFRLAQDPDQVKVLLCHP